MTKERSRLSNGVQISLLPKAFRDTTVSLLTVTEDGIGRLLDERGNMAKLMATGEKKSFYSAQNASTVVHTASETKMNALTSDHGASSRAKWITKPVELFPSSNYG